jgi:uncharacterized protein (TIGR02453 family)
MQAIISFLSDLAANNNREWFAANKPRYESSKNTMADFFENILAGLNTTDVIETPSGAKAMHRIYRDIRFKADKTPYKNTFSARFMRATAHRRGSYYIHIQPGNYFVGGGFWNPEPEDLKTIRNRIALEEGEYRAVLNEANFKKYYPQVLGERLKTAPKGFEKDHPALDLIQNKQFLLVHHFTEKEVHSKDFAKTVIVALEVMRPYLDIMTYFLTTNLDGELLV